MIAQSEIYVVGKGFVKPEDLFVGDQVYTLDNDKVDIEPITAVQSEFVSALLDRIDSGAHNVLMTPDALSLYHSEIYGYKYLKFGQIPNFTADKEYRSVKYVPVLTTPESSPRQISDSDLEWIARSLLVHDYDRPKFDDIMARVSGLDCLVLIDMLEFWCSITPGQGWFDRAQVKARSHPIYDRHFLDELCRAGVLAGYTASTSNFNQFQYALRVNYESRPIPGSRPKNEKYYKQHYTGMVYNCNASNKPILGRSLGGRTFYLPTRSTLQERN
jgi:hypothetical protein